MRDINSLQRSTNYGSYRIDFHVHRSLYKQDNEMTVTNLHKPVLLLGVPCMVTSWEGRWIDALVYKDMMKDKDKKIKNLEKQIDDLREKLNAKN